MLLAYYVSGHGLGHAVRALTVIEAIAARRPDWRVVVRTGAPGWVFEAAAPGLEVQACEADTGIVQLDGLRLDEPATVRRAAAFYGTFERRVADEARWLRARGARLVVGDVPPLASAAAARAGLPSVAVGNFTWDWIYGGYPAFATGAPHVLPTIRDAYALTTLALRVPLHGGFATTPHVRDLPLIARRSRRGRDETRAALSLRGDVPVVLASFGGYGAPLPFDALARDRSFALLAPAREPPAGFRYEDLVAAADVVVSKPGYGIVSECAANGASLVYTSRGRFIEYDVFVAEMPRVVRCRFLAQDDLLAGRWGEAVAAVLAQPAPPPPRVDGADLAADAIVSLCP